MSYSGTSRRQIIVFPVGSDQLVKTFNDVVDTGYVDVQVVHGEQHQWAIVGRNPTVAGGVKPAGGGTSILVGPGTDFHETFYGPGGSTPASVPGPAGPTAEGTIYGSGGLDADAVLGDPGISGAGFIVGFDSMGGIHVQPLAGYGEGDI